MKKYTYVDLFCGAGGLSLGFEKSGFENVFSLDVEPNFCKTYKKNFPTHKLITKDISQLTEDEIYALLDEKEVDIVVGGPPCQGFSMAGNIGRHFIDDPRNHLFKEFARVVSIIQPKMFLMENVARLDIHNKEKTKQEIIDIFTNMGYKVESRVLNAASFGVPQLRRRIIFIGRKDVGNIIFPKEQFSEKDYQTVEKAISQLPSLVSGESSNIPNHIAMSHSEQMLHKMSFVKDGGDRMDIPESIRPQKGDARKYIRYKSNRPSVCITGDMRKVFHYEQNRALTVRELARLQSFPDSFIFEGNSISQQQQVGNSVPPLLAASLANAIKEMLKDA